MDELSAQLDRHRSGTVSSSEDAASNALARFDDNDIETSIVQCARRSDSCRAAADDEHVRVQLRHGHAREQAGAVLNAIASAARRQLFSLWSAWKALALHMSWLVFPKEGYMSIRHSYSLFGALVGAGLLSYAAVAFADTERHACHARRLHHERVRLS